MAADRSLIASVILALGLALAGGLVGNGFARGRANDRYVTVKGVSEREVRASLALWPLRLVVSDNDLRAASSRVDAQVQLVREFLTKNGVNADQIELQEFSVSDSNTNQFRAPGGVSSRYVIHQTIMVRSNEADKILAASQHVGELVSAGIVLSSGEQYGNGGPTFVFTSLNELKPAMIAEATARAREGATQFAADSQSTVGGIRRASQGVFEILPRDQAPGVSEAGQIAKTVRVVSTVEYLLRD